MIKKLFKMPLFLIVLMLFSACSSKHFALNVEQHPKNNGNIAKNIITPPVTVKKIINIDDVEYKTPVFVGADSIIAGNKDGEIYVVLIKNYKLRWRLDLGAPIQARVYADKFIYAGTLAGNLYKISFSRKILWKKYLGYPIVGYIKKAKDRLYVTTEDNTLYCINANNGDIIWKFSKDYNTLSIRGASAALNKDGIYLGFNDGTISKLSENGNQIWEAEMGKGTLFVDVDAEPKKSSSSIFAASVNGYMKALDENSGDVIWKRKISGYSNIAIGEFVLFVADNGGNILAIDSSSGELLWKKKISNKVNVYAMHTSGDYLYAIDNHGTLAALDSLNGKVMDIKHISGEFDSNFSAYKDRLYVISRSGSIYTIYSHGEK